MVLCAKLAGRDRSTCTRGEACRCLNELSGNSGQLPGPVADVELLPLQVFSSGTWTYSETGQAFSAADLDEAAFVAYRDHLAQATEELRAEVAELRRMLWLAVQSEGGRLWIERRDVEAFDQDRAEVTFELCPQNDCFLILARDSQETGNG